jgi:cobalamin biosynthesis protein CobD/CbiB|nr:MAG TPA: hypothetical protein [Caudoviricetes sp.]
MERSKIAVIFALVIIACVLALIVIIPYACFLINFWLGLIVSIVFVASISRFLILVSRVIQGREIDKEENKIKEEYEKAVKDSQNRLMEQVIKMNKQRSNQ